MEDEGTRPEWSYDKGSLPSSSDSDEGPTSIALLVSQDARVLFVDGTSLLGSARSIFLSARDTAKGRIGPHLHTAPVPLTP